MASKRKAAPAASDDPLKVISPTAELEELARELIAEVRSLKARVQALEARPYYIPAVWPTYPLNCWGRSSLYGTVSADGVTVGGASLVLSGVQQAPSPGTVISYEYKPEVSDCLARYGDH
jgi:hypothetical protein